MTLREALTVIDDPNSIYNLDLDIEYVYDIRGHRRNLTNLTEEELNLTVVEIYSDCGINIDVRSN